MHFLMESLNDFETRHCWQGLIMHIGVLVYF